MKARRRYPGVFVALAGVGFFVSACGGSAGATGAHPAPSSAPLAASTPSRLQSVVLVEASDSLVEAPVVVAQSQHFFEAHGLAPKIEVLSGNTALSAMVGGSAQFDADVAGQVLTADGRGAPAVAFASLTEGNDNAIVVSSRYLSRHHVDLHADLKQRLSALAGARLGISAPGASSADTLQYMLNWAGLSPRSYSQIALGSGASLLSALKAGSIDAFLWSPPQPQEAVYQGFGTILARAQEIPALGAMAYACMVTTQSYLRQHPATVAAMAAAIGEAERFMAQHPNQTLAILERHFTYPVPVLKEALASIRYSQTGRIDPTAWQDTATVLQAMGIVSADRSVLAKAYTLLP
ncbi:MAG: ABC transporter substrate-binding protein [Firmicutes bacterium]|nr:ABC transporter substrate-binding protein [Bacillota bacterium]